MNMTKEQMKSKIEELQQEIERLENDIDYWQKEYNDMEEGKEKLDDLLAKMEISNGIKDTNNFIWKLKLDDKFSLQDEENIKIFIEEYLKFYNN